VSGRAETQTAASILGSALESVIEILSVKLSPLGASSPFGCNRRTPSVGENMMEIFMPRFVADDRAGRKRGFLLWFALFLQFQALSSFVRSEDKNSLSRRKNP
jgi:hypothetical protein